MQSLQPSFRPTLLWHRKFARMDGSAIIVIPLDEAFGSGQVAPAQSTSLLIRIP